MWRYGGHPRYTVHMESISVECPLCADTGRLKRLSSTMAARSGEGKSSGDGVDRTGRRVAPWPTQSEYRLTEMVAGTGTILVANWHRKPAIACS